MAFRDVPLPPCISAGSEATPVWQVDIARSPAGYEQRVSRRSASLRRFNVGYHIRRLEDLYDIVQHFEVMEGPTHSFPFLDRLDDRSCAPTVTPAMLDANIGTGDGAIAAFQLRKAYVAGAFTRYRTITLPVSGTVTIAVAGTLKTETTHYTVNYTTGIVTFTGGNIPTPGQAITAGFKYRCKVRYDANDLAQAYEGFRSGGIAAIALIEVAE